RREVGAPPRKNEDTAGSQPSGCWRSGTGKVELADSAAARAERLMRGERWDVFLAAFASCHRAGHQLGDATGAAGRAGGRTRHPTVTWRAARQHAWQSRGGAHEISRLPSTRCSPVAVPPDMRPTPAGWSGGESVHRFT